MTSIFPTPPLQAVWPWPSSSSSMSSIWCFSVFHPCWLLWIKSCPQSFLVVSASCTVSQRCGGELAQCTTDINALCIDLAVVLNTLVPGKASILSYSFRKRSAEGQVPQVFTVLLTLNCLIFCHYWQSEQQVTSAPRTLNHSVRLKLRGLLVGNILRPIHQTFFIL